MSRRILRTKLCDFLNIEYPIISAGMGPSLIGENSGAPVELVVAVSEAGGLGVLGAVGITVEEMRYQIREIKKQTDKPFGVDLLLAKQIVEAGDQPFNENEEIPLSEAIKSLPKAHYEWIMKIKDEMNLPDMEATITPGTTISRPYAAIKACIEEGVPLFCSGLGNPGFMVKDAHAVGMKVLGIAGNVKNAKRIAESGADLVVAQGHEGGGHTGRIGSFALWPQAIDAISPTPLVAAGGVGDGRGLASALVMGGAHPHVALAQCPMLEGYGAQRKVRKDFGWTLDDFADRLQPLYADLDPANYPDRADPSRILIVEAGEDDCFPADARAALYMALGQPERIVIPRGHKRAFLSMTPLGRSWLQERIWEFLSSSF